MNKGLEALKRLGWFQRQDGMCAFQADDYKTIEKELKALEIIKKKNVDIFTFTIAGCFERYHERRAFGLSLTHEEYDLLKEVLL